MPVPQRTSTVLRRGAVGLLVGGVILVMILVEARPDHPGDGRCAELWNAPANQTNRSVVRGRTFPLATVVTWDGGVSGVRYGTDSPTGGFDDSPNAMLQPDGSLVLR
jgi:hypothetical protein